MACKMSRFEEVWKIKGKWKNGDVIEFEMPPFCSGDYHFTIKNGVLPGAPAKIHTGCRGFILKRKGKVILDASM